MDWGKLADYYPRPDFLSSSRKRLVPQMLYKGGILKGWGKKQAVAIQRTFYETLPQLPEVERDKAEVAWFLYDLERINNRFQLVLSRTIYTELRTIAMKTTHHAEKTELLIGSNPDWLDGCSIDQYLP